MNEYYDQSLLNKSTIALQAAAPLITVVMPAYNASFFIVDAMRSVLDQDYPNIELIVVDDGSSDGTAAAAERFDDRVRVVRQRNAGPAAARNRGLEAAKGDFIAFLDADDVWLPGKLTAQVRYLQDHPETGVVFGGFMLWHPTVDGAFVPPPEPHNADGPLKLVAACSGWIYKDLLLDSVVCIITAMVRKSVLDAVGNFDESLRTGEDYDFWLRASRQFRADKLDRALACYRLHPGGTTKVPRAENNEYRVLQKNLALYGSTGPDNLAPTADALRARLFKLCFDHGYLHMRSGDPQVARNAFVTAIHHSPFEPKAWAYWMLAGLTHMLSGRSSKTREIHL
jgi:glycosyltransferase involved in cell wall biosynthesis